MALEHSINSKGRTTMLDTDWSNSLNFIKFWLLQSAELGYLSSDKKTGHLINPSS